MIPFETLTVFVTASVLLALAPGPDNIFVLTQSALRGRMAGVSVTLGLATGLLVHTAAVAFGVAAIFQASSEAFVALKTIGVAYLLYLAWQAFRAGPASASAHDTATSSSAGLFRLGIIMNLTNPKVAIFFLAFLPQFADPSRGPLWLQILGLGMVFIVAILPVFLAIAFGAGYLGEFLGRSPRALTALNRIAGTVFVALATSLAFAER